MSAGAALFGHHVFVDLETTGLDPAHDRVIELGALFVERGQVIHRIDRRFSPGIPVPAEVTALTGLSDAALCGRGSFEEYLPELAPLLAGWTLVAHNAEFERGFFAGLFERLDAPVLDSCELVHYLHPELPSHSLDALVRWTQLGDAAVHRALRDCEDTFAVLCHVLDGVVAQARGADVGDLLACLEGPGPAGAREPAGGALISLLEALFARCQSLPAAVTEQAPLRRPHQAPPSGTLTDYDLRASQAYLRALQRRSSPQPDQANPEVSSWFKRRYPAVAVFLPADAQP